MDLSDSVFRLQTRNSSSMIRSSMKQNEKSQNEKSHSYEEKEKNPLKGPEGKLRTEVTVPARASKSHKEVIQKDRVSLYQRILNKMASLRGK